VRQKVKRPSAKKDGAVAKRLARRRSESRSVVSGRPTERGAARSVPAVGVVRDLSISFCSQFDDEETMVQKVRTIIGMESTTGDDGVLDPNEQ